MKKLPSPYELHDRLPMTLRQREFVTQAQNKVFDIIHNRSDKLLIIAGPCSIHDFASAMAYATHLKELSVRVADTCIILMRAYVEKPRTRTGWTGLVNDPEIDGSFDIEAGLEHARRLFLALADIEMPIATELLHPLTYPYLSDTITWGCIGARTVTSQPHRQIASYAPFPIGFKNSIDGNIDVALDGVICARKPHRFTGINHNGHIASLQSSGNPHTHIVLRGSNNGPNYDLATLRHTQARIDQLELDCRILVDCSHGNCQKQEERQKDAFLTTLDHVVDGSADIMGMMLESHLESGNQPLAQARTRPNRSITDPCIDWHETESLILWAHETRQKGLASSEVGQ
ncbi:MAG: 3-deoxy-7-phosphoheptulonate synthase [Chlamydiia bacterium]|nr:3-deoxy-7-phosphoheptulonate synthase [Chlamydiia bacterium]